jgi:hypothetical protein
LVIAFHFPKDAVAPHRDFILEAKFHHLISIFVVELNRESYNT